MDIVFVISCEIKHFALGCFVGLLAYYLTYSTIRYICLQALRSNGQNAGVGFLNQIDGFIHSLSLAVALFSSLMSHMLVDYFMLGF